MATGRVPTTANSPLTAKGDLFGYSTTQARVPVGSDGETIVADSSTSTGLRWQVPKTQNAVYNSSFDIWQRGTSFTGLSPYYTADRWIGARAGAAAGGTWTRQSSGLTGFTYSARMQRDSGNTATTEMRFGQSLETADSVRFAGKTVTFSLYAKAGANYSGGSGGAYVVIYTGTGTDQQYWVSGFTGGAVLGIAYFTPTTSWQRFSVTATVGSSANEIAFGVAYGPSGTAGANDWLEVTGVQFEEGSVATPYTRQNATLAGELYACKRYYQREIRADVVMTANSFSTTNAQGGIQFTQEMRVAPTVTLAAAGQTGGTISFLTASANYPTTTGTNTAPSITAFGFQISGSGYSGLTANSASTLYANGSTTVYTASAEL